MVGSSVFPVFPPVPAESSAKLVSCAPAALLGDEMTFAGVHSPRSSNLLLSVCLSLGTQVESGRVPREEGPGLLFAPCSAGAPRGVPGVPTASAFTRPKQLVLWETEGCLGVVGGGRRPWALLTLECTGFLGK